MSHYRDFVRAVMLRYRSFDGHRGISAYQVWNEGNVSWSWTGTPQSLARITRSVWRIHQQVDPHATIVAPSFAVRLPSQRRWLSAYESQRVGGHPVRRYYDANALSLYPKVLYDGRPGGPEDAMRMLALAKQRLARAGVPRSKPLWASEVNYGVTGRATAAAPISERRQVANVIRTYVLGAARGLSRMFWYRYDWGALSPAKGGGTLGNTLLSVPESPGRAHTGRGRPRDGRALAARPVGRSGRAPALRSRPARDLHVRREARQWCAADPVEPGPIGTRPVPARSGRAATSGRAGQHRESARIDASRLLPPGDGRLTSLILGTQGPGGEQGLGHGGGLGPRRMGGPRPPFAGFPDRAAGVA